jgi:hypothetical protein
MGTMTCAPSWVAITAATEGEGEDRVGAALRARDLVVL